MSPENAIIWHIDDKKSDKTRQRRKKFPLVRGEWITLLPGLNPLKGRYYGYD
jgi:hypothetical protein